MPDQDHQAGIATNFERYEVENCAGNTQP